MRAPAVERWVSVEPMTPNMYGFTPDVFLCCKPVSSTLRKKSFFETHPIFRAPPRPVSPSSQIGLVLPSAARTSEAVDFDARYRFDTAFGEFAAGILGTRTLELETVFAPGADPVAQEGTNQGPAELKGSAYLDWSLGPWGANLTINHASSYENINPGVLRTDVDGYTTVDLQGSYVLPESGWRITAGVQNVFDEDFPFFDSYTGVNSAHVDSRRRVAFVDISREFSW